MNKIAKICVAILSVVAVTGSAYAAKPGAYVGAGLGGSKQDTPNHYLYTTNSKGIKQSKPHAGVAGRAFGGYNFNQYFGVEAGVAHYATSSYKSSVAKNSVNLDYGLNAIDVVGKAYLPVADSGFNLYALGGVALARSTNESKVILEQDNFKYTHSTKTTALRPIYGLGASYDVPSSPFTTALELSHLQGKGNVKTDKNAIPSANMVTFNLAYNLD